MTINKEVAFETEVCARLVANGWLHEPGDAPKYDRARALFPDDLVAWVKEAQPEAIETLVKNHGAKAEATLLDRVRAQLDQRGTLDVLRFGVELLGLKKPLALAQFKPALAINEEILARYGKNRLRVVRQVKYSLANENSLDLVLFLNGVPVATAELKTDFTQSVKDAIDQYREARNPKPKGQGVEPLLSFPQGALVHFAVSNREVHMTTFLDGAATKFLPFNRGDGGGAGNPVDPNGGHRTGYLFDEVLERHSWLEILGRYLIGELDRKKRPKRVIFPRYHQLDATRKLQAAVLRGGPGTKYLIQHSAGSGKTNSIAWTAHFLSELHDAANKKLFDSVLVVSDRNVIDAQLQDALFSFARTTGVVATIKGEGGSKSKELAEALAGGKKIVVCTIQTFPFALETVRELAATEGKRFAVIADEAHSSQSGEAAAKLKAVLSAEELKEIEDGGEIGAEDVLAAQMSARAEDRGVTFVAFTATPKNKTLEIFGTRPDPSRKPAEDNVPRPFHVYSMRQAIEEGFILDVLRNYTSYSTAFRLAHDGKAVDSAEVERTAALKRLMGWVKLHPYNIAQKVEVVVEHFRARVAPLLGGRAKAMVVVGSRVEAVRWKLAIDKFIREKNYLIGTLVAFSGEVNDRESSPDPVGEHSKLLNPGLNGRDIRDAFDGDDFRILLVANKFQTGFDQPLLCGMYVDKRLAGIQAVQTLSRLNLDFVNDPDEILKAFQTYYETAELETTTDPNLVFDLRSKLDAAGHYDDYEVERVVKVELDPAAKQSDLIKAIEPVFDRLMKRYAAAREALATARKLGDAKAEAAAKEETDALLLFRTDMGTYLRLYTFLSQIFDYGQTALEKRAIFYKRLVPLLDFERERVGIDLSKVQLTHHALRDKGTGHLPLRSGTGDRLYPITDSGAGAVQEKQKALLAELIEHVNELFSGDLTDEDKLVYVNEVLRTKLLESPVLRTQAANNTKEQFAASPDLSSALEGAIMDAYDAHTAMSSQALGSKSLQSSLLRLLLDYAGLYEALRARSAG
jgi:type I restriction enzyme, R subunit